MTDNFTDAETLVDTIVARVGRDIRLGLPLGLGKANTIVNALVDRALQDPDLQLEIFTALTLERPAPSGDLENRFLSPALDRLFGAYPPLRYAELLRSGGLPDNIAVHEFFFLAGRWLGYGPAQQAYIPANYTHALHYLIDRRPNVLAQLVAREDGRFSLSGNTDITADLLKARHAGKADFLIAAEVNPELPFMPGSGEIGSGEIDLLLDDPDTQFELFSAVKRPVSLADHAIGLHVSQLVRDGGTLQIGIGSIGDAIASALILRHDAPDTLQRILAEGPFTGPIGQTETQPFEKGLYSVTEMLVDGIVQLMRANIVKREVDGVAIHAGFFVESRDFYARLRNMPLPERAKIGMMPVSFTNQLYGNEAAKRAARGDARFVNSAMKVTALGGVVSDSTSAGETVSGVGGQFNFVDQAHALDGARSIITLNATRDGKGGAQSNIVWDHPHETIPRHLRDIVVTEYGVADLRGVPDDQAVLAMIAIADSRFQEQLLRRAKSAGKVAPDAFVPGGSQPNTPERLARWLRPWRRRGHLPAFPFGTDFTDTEQALLPALALLQRSQRAPLRLAGLVLRGMRTSPDAVADACLDRLRLADVRAPRERVLAWAVLGALADTREG